MEDKQLELAAEVLRALGHPLRLKIIEFLRAGERCVCEIIPAVGAEQSVVSKHLSVLRQAGILEARKDGLRVIYRIRDPAVPDLCDLAREIMARRLGELAELVTTLEGFTRQKNE